jgi:hypothetical protein
MNEHRLSRIMHLSLERYVGHLDDVHHNNNNKRRATSETITISESVNVCVSAIPTTCNGSLTKEDSILMEARAAREEHMQRLRDEDHDYDEEQHSPSRKHLNSKYVLTEKRNYAMIMKKEKQIAQNDKKRNG